MLGWQPHFPLQALSDSVLLAVARRVLVSSFHFHSHLLGGFPAPSTQLFNFLEPPWVCYQGLPVSAGLVLSVRPIQSCGVSLKTAS